MSSGRKMGLAVAQMGPNNSTDTRAQVMGRILEMLREAKGRGADLVVFPELAFTTSSADSARRCMRWTACRSTSDVARRSR